MGPKAKPKVEEVIPEPVQPEIPPVTLENYLDFLPIYDELFQDYPFTRSRDVSKSERDLNHYTSSSLVYGEITYESFAEEFLKIRDRYGYRAVGGKYVDIGSGSGKSLFSAALVHKFEDCVGIEILKDLYEISEDRHQAWNGMIARNEQLAHLQHTRIQFLHGDATAIKWADADVVFMNSTCFEDSLLAKFAELCSELKPGSFVLTTTSNLPSSDYEILEVSTLKQKWGECTLYIQRRKGFNPI